ncbi:hypothetical protein AX16_010790, partial [Volvariella volvacea WC 439]
DTATHNYLNHITNKHSGNTPLCNIACTLAEIHYAYQCIKEHLSLMQVFMDDLKVITNTTSCAIRYLLEELA